MSRTSVPLIKGVGSYDDPSHRLVEFSIGTPPQRFEALLDIGWPDTAAPSMHYTRELLSYHNLLEPEDYDGFYLIEKLHDGYDEAASSTAIQLPKRKVRYARDFESLFLEGFKRQDSMTLGDIIVHRQAFCRMYTVRDDGNRIGRVGGWFLGGNGFHYRILGLAANRNRESEHPVYNGKLEHPSVFQNAIDSGVLERNVFSLYPPLDEDSPGALHMGWIDPSFTDRLVTIPISQPPEHPGIESVNPWHVSVNSISMSGREIKLENCHAFFSTATSYVHVSPDIFDAAQLARQREENQEDDDSGVDVEWIGPLITISFGPQEWLVTVEPKLYIHSQLQEFGNFYAISWLQSLDDYSSTWEEWEERGYGDTDEEEDPEDEDIKDECMKDVDMEDVPMEDESMEAKHIDTKSVAVEDKEEQRRYNTEQKGAEYKTIILGTAFLDQFYSVFDADANTVSLAPIKKFNVAGMEDEV